MRAAPRLTPRRFAFALAAMAVLASTAAVAGLAGGIGQVDWAHALNNPWDPTNVDAVIVWRSRLPRVMAGMVLGGGLAAVGVVFQAMLRNPLADPYILGVSGGAAIGGTLAIAVIPAGLLAHLPGVPLLAFGGALAATTLMWQVARGRHGASPLVVLLGGVVFNAFAGAMVMLVQTVVVARKAQEILFWLLGSLAVETVDGTALAGAGGVVLVGLALVMTAGGQLNALALGDEGALSLGVDVQRLRRRLLLASCFIIGAAVSVGGMIGFVGLIVPHALRLMLGPDHRLLLPAAFLGGGSFLVICDLVGRRLFVVLTTELPVGVITALLGSPVFLYLLWRERDRLLAS